MKKKKNESIWERANKLMGWLSLPGWISTSWKLIWKIIGWFGNIQFVHENWRWVPRLSSTVRTPAIENSLLVVGPMWLVIVVLYGDRLRDRFRPSKIVGVAAASMVIVAVLVSAIVELRHESPRLHSGPVASSSGNKPNPEGVDNIHLPASDLAVPASRNEQGSPLRKAASARAKVKAQGEQVAANTSVPQTVDCGNGFAARTLDDCSGGDWEIRRNWFVNSRGIDIPANAHRVLEDGNVYIHPPKGVKISGQDTTFTNNLVGTTDFEVTADARRTFVSNNILRPDPLMAKIVEKQSQVGEVNAILSDMRSSFERLWNGLPKQQVLSNEEILKMLERTIRSVPLDRDLAESLLKQLVVNTPKQP